MACCKPRYYGARGGKGGLRGLFWGLGESQEPGGEGKGVRDKGTGVIFLDYPSRVSQLETGEQGNLCPL